MVRRQSGVATEFDDRQRVLSEASHDLANRFHRAYYFIEMLGDALGPDADTAGSLLARLRGAVEDIEAMARRTLEFVGPIELRTLRVSMHDLTASLRQHAGLRTVELRGDAAAGHCEVEVDPARISEALAYLCKAAIADDDSQAPLVVELLDGDPIALRIYRTPGASAPARADLSLALTARIARLHGGALDSDEGDASSLTLRLPVVRRGT